MFFLYTTLGDFLPWKKRNFLISLPSQRFVQTSFQAYPIYDWITIKFGIMLIKLEKAKGEVT